MAHFPKPQEHHDSVEERTRAHGASRRPGVGPGAPVASQQLPSACHAMSIQRQHQRGARRGLRGFLELASESPFVGPDPLFNTERAQLVTLAQLLVNRPNLA